MCRMILSVYDTKCTGEPADQNTVRWDRSAWSAWTWQSLIKSNVPQRRWQKPGRKRRTPAMKAPPCRAGAWGLRYRARPSMTFHILSAQPSSLVVIRSWALRYRCWLSCLSRQHWEVGLLVPAYSSGCLHPRRYDSSRFYAWLQAAMLLHGHAQRRIAIVLLFWFVNSLSHVLSIYNGVSWTGRTDSCSICNEWHYFIKRSNIINQLQSMVTLITLSLTVKKTLRT